jgi:hypothetical protein
MHRVDLVNAEDGFLSLLVNCDAPEGAECRLMCADGCMDWVVGDHEHALVDAGYCLAAESFQHTVNRVHSSGSVLWSRFVTLEWSASEARYRLATPVKDRPVQDRALAAIMEERENQDTKWGVQTWPSGTSATYGRLRDLARAECDASFNAGSLTWKHILDEEVLEAFAETDPKLLLGELTQAAAVIVAWMENLYRQADPSLLEAVQ